MKQPTDRRNREVEMMAAALDIFATKGYAASSVQDVANAVGVLKGSLYHYIKTKEDLLSKLLGSAHAENEVLMNKVTALDVDPVEKLRIYIEGLIKKTLRSVDLTTLYFREWRSLTGERREMLVKQRRQYDRFLRNLISGALDSAGLVPDVEVRQLSTFVISGTSWIADSYTAQGRTIERDAAGYTKIAMAAILGSAHKA